MKDYQTRVIDEHAELEEKVEKLSAFLASGPDIALAERSYLEAQLPHMRAYLAVLRSRCEMYAAEPVEEDEEK